MTSWRRAKSRYAAVRFGSKRSALAISAVRHRDPAHATEGDEDPVLTVQPVLCGLVAIRMGEDRVRPAERGGEEDLRRHHLVVDTVAQGQPAKSK